ncbi:hypothetical protein [Mycobacterium sp. SMC-8]|uniref:hypothetical protein n=1 Tax=Mycobacterium sp. SMC-8 TaxID=2857060 RepID=UPI0021B44BC2|nr:hypothetical protein [Mycobacterium sp. SMC-8]
MSIAAWDLVEHCQTGMTPTERNTAYVRLGVGDYNDAMVIALQSAARGDEPLPGPLLARLLTLQQVYYFDRDLAELLSTAARA